MMLCNFPLPPPNKYPGCVHMAVRVQCIIIYVCSETMAQVEHDPRAVGNRGERDVRTADSVLLSHDRAVGRGVHARRPVPCARQVGRIASPGHVDVLVSDHGVRGRGAVHAAPADVPRWTANGGTPPVHTIISRTTFCPMLAPMYSPSPPLYYIVAIRPHPRYECRWEKSRAHLYIKVIINYIKV